ncbi:MAG: IclR family transcriptional regulator, partial [Fretibacterium sp.]|nr:IclR family transcriptional regulator [Fretibacterium sp.]
SRVGIVDAARPELERLAAASGETAYLAIESGDSILYLDKVESTRPVAPTHNIGDTNSLYATALGKALLASRTDDEVRQKLDGVMEPITDNTIVSVDELIEDMAATRKRGYAIDDRESCDFMVCVAAPVLDASGSAIAAISVAMINYQKCDIEDIAFNVVKSARSISKKQGFFGDALYGA